MKFTESWLRTLVDTPLTTQDMSHVLTMSGLEVEACEPVAPPFTQVVVGQVLSVVKHPQADRLNVLEVHVGQERPLQIVCGAPNVTPGMKAPCALVGAQLPNDLVIRAAKVRGIESFGMMCSEKELGLSSEGHGLLELEPQAPPGSSLRDWLELDDTVLTLKLTPNRADCLSVLGIARELSVLTQCSLKPLAAHSEQRQASGQTPTEQERQVHLQDPQACGRYLGRTLHLDHPDQPTPAWMLRRLQRCGIRGKNLVVDVTNYVMLELGQPLHAFDATRLQGDLSVRWAQPQETLQLLNEQSVALTEDMLVIADQQGPVALAGIMGGLHSAVTGQSSQVFLEAAWFAPQALAGRARRLGLNSEAAHRFERGVDFTLAHQAIAYATHLLLEIASGYAGQLVDCAGIVPNRPTVLVRTDRVRRVLGMALSDERIARLLAQLPGQMQVSQETKGFLLTPPSARFDLNIEADYIEEIARLEGYDHIPTQTPVARMRLSGLPEAVRDPAELRNLLMHRGFQEVMTYSFIAGSELDKFTPEQHRIALLNPIASQYSHLRTTIAPGLIQVLRYNLGRKQERLRIFEMGRCFVRDSRNGYQQEQRLAALLYGSRCPEQWSVVTEPVDFFDLKAEVEALFPSSQNLQFQACAEHPALHPGRAARVTLGDRAIGWLGELHPRLVAGYELARAPLLFELELEPLLSCAIPRFVELPRTQPVRRDLAFVVDDNLPVETLLNCLRETRAPFVTDLDVFDLYRGAGLPNGKKSVAFRVVIQDTERTLTESELEMTTAALVAAVSTAFGAELR